MLYSILQYQEAIKEFLALMALTEETALMD
jgi:hypothetical protein